MGTRLVVSGESTAIHGKIPSMGITEKSVTGTFVYRNLLVSSYWVGLLEIVADHSEHFREIKRYKDFRVSAWDLSIYKQVILVSLDSIVIFLFYLKCLVSL